VEKSRESFFDNRSRLNFVSGKGGVGKTTISCALALKASRSGQETLLFAINPSQPLETFFGMLSRQGEGPHEILPRLWVHNLDQQEIFDDFIRDSLKIRRIYEAVLTSHIYQYFTAIAPGIKELYTQDLIISALQRVKRFQRRFFDLILVDSPATGHGLSWFSVPDAVQSTFLVGPMNKKAREIKEVWLDHEMTSIHLATLPEEMPVNETIHYYRTISAKLNDPVKHIFLNCVFPGLVEGNECAGLDRLIEENQLKMTIPARSVDGDGVLARILPLIGETAQFYRNRRKLNEHFRAEISQAIPLPLIEIPMIFNREASPLDLLEKIGEWL
jgi:anion-transporting  ArsA/GET3 family ATPase